MKKMQGMIDARVTVGEFRTLEKVIDTLPTMQSIADMESEFKDYLKTEPFFEWANLFEKRVEQLTTESRQKISE
jgi:hypothetical protein